MRTRAGRTHLADVLLAAPAAVIRGPDLYLVGEDSEEPNGDCVRIDGRWVCLRKAGALFAHLLRRLLSRGFETSPEVVEQLWALQPLTRLADPEASLIRLHAIAWTLCFMQDVEEQLQRLERHEAVEATGPPEGPHAAALPAPWPAPGLTGLKAICELDLLPDPALVMGGIVHGLEPAAQEEECDGEVILRGCRLRPGPPLMTCDLLDERVRSRPAELGPESGALRGIYLEIAERWQRRIEQGQSDPRAGIVLREFAAPDARFRAIAHAGCLGVSLDVSPYIICDRAGKAYRFDACVLGTLVPIPVDRSLLLSHPYVIWPEHYDSPFVPAERSHPSVCTDGFLTERYAAERRSHTIIDWLLCTRHILRAGFFRSERSLTPHNDPQRWPGRRVSAAELSRTELPVFRFERGG